MKKKLFSTPKVEKIQVSSYEEVAWCKCGGEMKFSFTQDIAPPRYVHICKKCKKRETYRSTYPRRVSVRMR